MKPEELLVKRHNIIENFLKLISIHNDVSEETEKFESTINDETLDAITDLLSFFHEFPDIKERFFLYRTKK